MSLTPYLTFDGDCENAFAFYADLFEGTVTALQRYGDAPGSEDLPPAEHDRVMHAHLVADGLALMGADAMPGRYEPPQGLRLAVHTATPDDAERVFAALADGGAVTLPLAETFRAQRFGMLEDRFGIPWTVNCERAPDERGDHAAP